MVLNCIACLIFLTFNHKGQKMVEHDTEEVIQSQRVNEHKNILDMIDMLSKRVRKLEDAVPVTLLATLENLETRLNKGKKAIINKDCI